jgi:DNA-binding PucR family transcriptional regulator
MQQLASSPGGSGDGPADGRADGTGEPVDTEQHLAELVVGADPEALDDLCARVLAPLAELKPAASERLAETLRSWLLHQGRRDAVAADLHVHAQTVRYRMGQLRELYGDRLDDPRTVLELVLALHRADRQVPDDPDPTDAEGSRDSPPAAPVTT